MLKISKDIILNGSSRFDNAIVQGYQATINNEAPENMQLTNWISDYALYKIHREDCANDRAEFEDKAFKLQEELMAEKSKTMLE